MIRQNKTSHLPTASAESKPGFSLVIIFWDGVAGGIWFFCFLCVYGSLAKSTMLQVQLWQICWNRIHLVDNATGANRWFAWTIEPRRSVCGDPDPDIPPGIFTNPFHLFLICKRAGRLHLELGHLFKKKKKNTFGRWLGRANQANQLLADIVSQYVFFSYASVLSCQASRGHQLSDWGIMLR